jgi:hypothetical protein
MRRVVDSGANRSCVLAHVSSSMICHSGISTVIVVAPHVLPLFGPTNPQVLARFRGDVEAGASDRQSRSGGARDQFSSFS